jgi:hypothetical protein
MNFRPELADAVMTGRKTVTRRLTSSNPRSPWYEGGCSLVIGRDYAICPGRGKPAIGRAYVTALHLERVGDVFGETLGEQAGDAEALAEGFESGVAFKLAWLKINGSYDPGAQVWAIGLRAV